MRQGREEGKGKIADHVKYKRVLQVTLFLITLNGRPAGVFSFLFSFSLSKEFAA